jgi:hypothetical protein
MRWRVELGDMDENPYNAPQADLTPADWSVRRQRFLAYVRDRATLWAIAGVFFLLLIVPAYNTSWLACIAAIVISFATIAIYELVAWFDRFLRS